jgi:hypothetical protein
VAYAQRKTIVQPVFGQMAILQGGPLPAAPRGRADPTSPDRWGLRLREPDAIIVDLHVVPSVRTISRSREAGENTTLRLMRHDSRP